jgi:hypothetical protein
MIIKIYRERGKNKKSRRRRGLTLTGIIPMLVKVGTGLQWSTRHIQKGKEMVTTDQDRLSPLFCPS